MSLKKCIGTKTKTGCNDEKPLKEFGISSRNQNTGQIYHKNICRQCEYRVKMVVKPPTTEAVLYKELSKIWPCAIKG